MDEVSMKPLIGLAIQEAVKLALIDCLDPHQVTDEDRMRYRWDIHSVPDELWAGIDPTALAQNVACRLIGTGGWTVNGVYAGNATPKQILESCIERPDEDPNGDIKLWLNGLDKDLS